MRSLGIVIALAVVVAMAAVGGYYTANRTGNVPLGVLLGVAFVAIFVGVLWRALHAEE